MSPPVAPPIADHPPTVMSSPTPARPRPTLDAEAVARLRELDPDGRHRVVMRVLTAFESSLTRMLVQLAAERQDGDADAVSNIAHTLKSSSASVGALELAQACGDVERRLRAGEGGNLTADIELLLMAGESALVAVGAMLRP